jgi:hypothetical protein
MLTAGHWLLPKRTPAAASYEDVRQYTSEMMVEPDSPLIGKSIEDAGLRQLPGLFLIEIERGEQVMAAVSSQEVLQANDRLVFAGILDSVMDLQRTRGLIPATNQVFKLDVPRPGRCFVEAVLSDKSPLVGKSVRAGPVPQSLRCGDHRARAQRRAGRPQDRRYRPGAGRHPPLGDAPGLRGAAEKLAGLPAGESDRRFAPAQAQAGAGRHRHRGRDGRGRHRWAGSACWRPHSWPPGS